MKTFNKVEYMTNPSIETIIFLTKLKCKKS